MSRPKGSKNKQPADVPWPMNLSTEERMKLLANIIVDTIIEDQKQGGVLLKKILAEESARERQSQSKQHNDIPTKEGG